MRQYRVKISEVAEHDIENAGDYIAYVIKNPTAAENFVRGIREKIDQLKRFPNRNQLDEDELLASLEVRIDYYKDYKIYYKISGNIVVIIRVLHMRVDSKPLLYYTLKL